MSKMFDLSFLFDNATTIPGAVILFTIFALIWSTKYTFSRIGKIWNAGDPRKVISDDKDREQEEDCDGDDEQEEDEDKEERDGDGDHPPTVNGIDPVEYCEHIQGEVKRVRQKVTTKKIQDGLSKEQIKEERNLKSQQLEQIFKMMEEQPDKFGMTSMDDVKRQMSLYG